MLAYIEEEKKNTTTNTFHANFVNLCNENTPCGCKYSFKTISYLRDSLHVFDTLHNR